LIGAFFLFPLSLFRSLDPLKYTSFVAIVNVAYVVTMVVVKATIAEPQQTPMDPFRFDNQMFRAFPLMVVAFCGHYNALRLYEEMEDRSPPKMYKVIFISVAVCMVIYTTIGYAGYSEFRLKTTDNILNAYGSSEIEVLFARLAMGFTICFSYPLVHHALRKNVDMLFFPGRLESQLRLRLLSVVLVSLHVVVGILVPDVSTVLGFSGSTFGVCLVYILPAVIFLKLCSGPIPKVFEEPSMSTNVGLKEALLFDDDETSFEEEVTPPSMESSACLKVLGVGQILCGLAFGACGVYINVYRLLYPPPP